jgi:hypothetical protein
MTGDTVFLSVNKRPLSDVARLGLSSGAFHVPSCPDRRAQTTARANYRDAKKIKFNSGTCPLCVKLGGMEGKCDTYGLVSFIEILIMSGRPVRPCVLFVKVHLWQLDKARGTSDDITSRDNNGKLN